MKQCPKCKIYKPKSGFTKNKRSKDKLQCYCKVCIKRWQKENKELLYFAMRKSYDKKREFYIRYKKNLECQQCGENHPACLEFHHRYPKEKDFRVGSSVGIYSIERIMNEIAKCDVLCANCHRKLHYDLKREQLKHSKY